MRSNAVCSTLILAATAVVTLAVIGCATPCEQIARQRQEMIDRRVEPTAEPHLVAAVSLQVVNEMIALRAREIEPQRLEVPMSGVLSSLSGIVLDDLMLRPASVEVVPSPQGRVGIVVLLDVGPPNETYFGMRVAGDVEPRFDPQTHRVDVELRIDDFRSMEPIMSEGAADRLGQALHRQLPAMMRLLVPPQAIAEAARFVTTFVLTSAYPLLRDALFTDLGPVARFSVALPDLPIERIDFSTTADDGGRLVLAMHTGLPVAAGIGVPDALELAEHGGIDVTVAGPAVAELANWGMREGRLPARYDDRGQPTDGGPYQVALSWSTEPGDPRPLRVHVWKLEPRCLHAVIAARPELRLEGGELVLEVRDRRVEELEGPPLAEVARWLAPLWLRALSSTQSVASTFALEAGGRSLSARVTDVSITGAAVRLRVDLVEPYTQ
jgi:hypothetical protein